MMYRNLTTGKIIAPKNSGSVSQRLLKDTEVEAQYGISRFTLRADRVRARKFKFVKIGRSVFYRTEDIEKTLDQHAVTNPIG